MAFSKRLRTNPSMSIRAEEETPANLLRQSNVQKKWTVAMTSGRSEMVMALITLLHVLYVSVETHFRWNNQVSKEVYFTSTWLYLVGVNSLFTITYFIEIILNLVVHGKAFLLQPDNWFNFATASLSWLSDMLGWWACFSYIDTPRDILQVVGIFRIFRVVRQVGTRFGAVVVIKGFFYSVVSLVWISVFLFILLYVFANLTVRYFIGVSKSISNEEMGVYWGSLSTSIYTLFLMLTFDGWSDIALTTQDIFPWSPPLLVVYIATTGVIVLSIVTSVMVHAYITASKALHTDEIYRTQLEKERCAADAFRQIFFGEGSCASEGSVEGEGLVGAGDRMTDRSPVSVSSFPPAPKRRSHRHPSGKSVIGRVEGQAPISARMEDGQGRPPGGAVVLPSEEGGWRFGTAPGAPYFSTMPDSARRTPRQLAIPQSPPFDRVPFSMGSLEDSEPSFLTAVYTLGPSEGGSPRTPRHTARRQSVQRTRKAHSRTSSEKRPSSTRPLPELEIPERRKGARLQLKGRTASQVVEILAPGLEAAGIGRNEALEAVQLMKHYNIPEASAVDIAEACSWVADAGTGRQVFVSKVENSTYMSSMKQRIEHLSDRAAEAERLVNRLAEVLGTEID